MDFLRSFMKREKTLSEKMNDLIEEFKQNSDERKKGEIMEKLEVNLEKMKENLKVIEEKFREEERKLDPTINIKLERNSGYLLDELYFQSEDLEKEIHKYEEEIKKLKEDLPSPLPTLYSGECGICMEKIKRGDGHTMCKNGHNFHDDCLQPWIDRNHTCPTCRTDEFHHFPKYKAGKSRRKKLKKGKRKTNRRRK